MVLANPMVSHTIGEQTRWLAPPRGSGCRCLHILSRCARGLQTHVYAKK